MFVYGIMFAGGGAGVGLGVGLVLGRTARSSIECFMGGSLAGLAAAVLYPIVIAVLLPSALTSVLIPVEPVDQLAWFGLAAACLGVVVPSLAGRSRSNAAMSGPLRGDLDNPFRW
jgi:hypothetical protein